MFFHRNETFFFQTVIHLSIQWDISKYYRFFFLVSEASECSPLNSLTLFFWVTHLACFLLELFLSSSVFWVDYLLQTKHGWLWFIPLSLFNPAKCSLSHHSSLNCSSPPSLKHIKWILQTIIYMYVHMYNLKLHSLIIIATIFSTSSLLPSLQKRLYDKETISSRTIIYVQKVYFNWVIFQMVDTEMTL